MPADWAWKPLESLVAIDRESLGAETRLDYEFNYIDIGSVRTGSSILPARKLRFRHAPSRARKRVSFGDVLMATVRPNLKAFTVFKDKGEDFIASTGFAVLTPLEDNVSGFVFHSLLSDYLSLQIDNHTTGSNYPAISSSNIARLQVATPPPPEQRLIAAILDTLDDVIRQTEASIEKLKLVKAGMLHNLLTCGLDENGELRDPVSHPEQFNKSSAGMMPRDWMVSPLGKVLKDVGGQLQTGPFGSQLHACEYQSNGVPVIMPQNIEDGRVELIGIARVTEGKATSLARHRVNPGDMVFARRGDLARVAAVSEREKGWLCGTGCFLLRAPPDKINCRWLAMVYRHTHIQSQIAGRTVGSTMPSLNNGIMESLEISWPQRWEQDLIVARLDAMDSSIHSESERCEKLRSIKQGLMQDLLTGRVRVTNLQEIAA